MIKNFEDFLNENQNIDEIIDFEQLNESFNDNKISNAINQHGGIDKRLREFGAIHYADYDLKNAKYVGYLTPETVENIEEVSLRFKLRKDLIYTNDGGAIVVSNTTSYNFTGKRNEWEDKVSKRNKNWGEEEKNKEKYGFRKEIYVKPNEFNTIDRRQDNKKYK
jgi:hypothetical protein